MSRPMQKANAETKETTKSDSCIIENWMNMWVEIGYLLSAASFAASAPAPAAKISFYSILNKAHLSPSRRPLWASHLSESPYQLRQVFSRTTLHEFPTNGWSSHPVLSANSSSRPIMHSTIQQYQSRFRKSWWCFYYDEWLVFAGEQPYTVSKTKLSLPNLCWKQSCNSLSLICVRD